MKTAEIEIVDAIMDRAARMGMIQVTTENLALNADDKCGFRGASRQVRDRFRCRVVAGRRPDGTIDGGRSPHQMVVR